MDGEESGLGGKGWGWRGEGARQFLEGQLILDYVTSCYKSRATFLFIY